MGGLGSVSYLNARYERNSHILGFQIFWNFVEVSVRMLESFSWVIIHDTFLLTACNDGFGCFQALAIVILVPRKIKWISVSDALGRSGMCALRIVTSGDLGTWHAITL